MECLTIVSKHMNPVFRCRLTTKDAIITIRDNTTQQLQKQPTPMTILDEYLNSALRTWPLFTERGKEHSTEAEQLKGFYKC